jgi:hypothetical protein
MEENCHLNFKPFCEFHQRDISKILVIFASFVVNLMSGVFMYFIIWYERFGSDSKRIMTNKFVSMICWYAIIGLQLAFWSDTYFFLFAPMSTFSCQTIAFVRMTIASNILTFLNFIVISKYIFIFWMKNPGSVQDDFWHVFISLWTFCFSCIFSLVKMFQPRKEMIFYYIAIDGDPDTDNHLKARADDQIEPLFCFLLHLAITLRVQIFKYIKNHNSSSVAPQQLPISTITQMYFQNMGKVTLADFLTSSILAVWIGSLAVLQNTIDNLSLAQISSPNYSFLLFGFLYYANSFSGVAISGVYLCRHYDLREKIKKELLSVIQNITSNN